MEALKDTPVLKFDPNTKEEVRGLYDLNKPGRMEEAIRLLEDWIQKQEHFVNKNFDRGYLERLIITNKGLTERVKSKLEKLCTFRTLIPEFFKFCDVREITNMPHFNDVISDAIMTKMTPDYYRVYLIKYNNVNYLTQDMMAANYRLLFVTWEYICKHDYTAGYVIINDFRDINLLDFISKLNISEIRKLTTVLQEGYGMRLKEVHYLTNSSFIEKFINFTKPFTPGKVADRIYTHTNLESLHQMVPKEILCAEYGGNELPLNDLRNLWRDTLASQEHEDYMKMVNQFRTDESKRIGGQVSDEYLPGSFRTLSVD